MMNFLKLEWAPEQRPLSFWKKTYWLFSVLFNKLTSFELIMKVSSPGFENIVPFLSIFDSTKMS